MTAIARSASTPLRGVLAFVFLELRRTLRNRRYVMFGVAFPTVFYLLYTGVLSGAAARNDAPIDGTTWGAYFMVSMAAYAAIVAAIGGSAVIAQDRASGWTRQLRVTPIPSTGYVAGKLLVSYVVTVPAIAAVLVAGVLVNQVELSALVWVQLLVSLTIGALPFAAAGLLIGYTFGPESAQGAMVVTFFSLAILGGLWAPISTFPDTLATIGRMLPSYHVAELGREAVRGGAPDPMHLVVLAAYGTVIGGLVAWRYRASEQHAGG